MGVLSFQWEDLDKNRPSEDYEDPELVDAIRYAQENMGDFKLKTAKDYVVPEDQRLTANRKREELILLRNQVSYSLFTCTNYIILSLKNAI